VAQGLPVLRADALHSHVDMHQAYGGVVPELASRDHIRRVLPLTEAVLARAGTTLSQLDVIAYTRGPGLAGALLVGAGVACALGAALDKPVLGMHHLEGHLLSPFLSSDPPSFPFIALLVSGCHTQLMRVDGVGLETPLAGPAHAFLGEVEAHDRLGHCGKPGVDPLPLFELRLHAALVHEPDMDHVPAGAEVEQHLDAVARSAAGKTLTPARDLLRRGAHAAYFDVARVSLESAATTGPLLGRPFVPATLVRRRVSGDLRGRSRLFTRACLFLAL